MRPPSATPLVKPLVAAAGAVAVVVTVVVTVGCSSCASPERRAASPPAAAAGGDRSRAASARAPSPASAKATPTSHPAADDPDRTGAGLARGWFRVAGGCTGRRRGRPAVLCVDARRSTKRGRSDGTAAAPFGRIQAAVAAASSGDEIRVAGGTYRENVEIRAKALKLLGGFVGAEATAYAAGRAGDFGQRAPSERVTTIEAAGGDATVVLIEAATSRVEGFRITGGTGNPLQKKYYYLGGGIYISEGSPTIARNLIERNDIVSTHPKLAVENLGGGVFAESARVEILANRVRGNVSGRGALATHDCPSARVVGNAVVDNVAVGDHGAGIYVSGPRIEVRDNYVAGNRVVPRSAEGGGWGGGIMVYDKGSRAELSGNVVTGNHAPEIGSGTFIDDGATVTLRNELIYDNRCTTGGGAGVYVDGLDRKTRSRATLINVTIAGHSCPGVGNALYVENAAVELASSIVWDNRHDFHVSGGASLRVRHSLCRDRVPGAGNVAGADPLFADPGSGDYHLRSVSGRWQRRTGSWVKDTVHSPAIDAGDPRAPASAEPPPNGGRINLGAHGGTAEASKSR